MLMFYKCVPYLGAKRNYKVIVGPLSLKLGKTDAVISATL